MFLDLHSNILPTSPFLPPVQDADHSVTLTLSCTGGLMAVAS